MKTKIIYPQISIRKEPFISFLPFVFKPDEKKVTAETQRNGSYFSRLNCGDWLAIVERHWACRRSVVAISRVGSMLGFCRRRLIQFSVGSLLGVTAIIAAFLAWEMRPIHKRQAIQRALELDGGIVLAANPVDPTSRSAIPWWRSCLGDSPVAFIVIGRSGNPSEAELREVFPEVEVILPHSQEGWVGYPPLQP